MPEKLTSPASLYTHFALIFERADHHGQNVNLVATLLVEFLISKKVKEIEICRRKGEILNALWCEVGGERFYLRYDYDDESIVLKRWSQQGPEIARFTNLSGIRDIRRAFASKQTEALASAQQTEEHSAHL